MTQYIPSLLDLCSSAISRNYLSLFCHQSLPYDLRQYLHKQLLMKNNLTDEHFLRLSGGLKHLDLEECKTLSSMALTQLGTITNTNLEILNLSSCESVTDLVLHSIWNNCPNLKVLFVNNCNGLTENAFHGISKGCPGLEVLEIGAPTRDRKTPCKFTMANSLLCLCDLSNLKSLSLQNWLSLTDEGLAWIGKNLLQLTTIDISNCRAVTDEGIAALCSYNPNRFLNINLSGCVKLTNLSMVVLARCTALTSLHLNSNNKINDEGLWHLSKGNINLTNLVLSYLDNVTDQTISNLSSLPHLHDLSLHFLRSISMDSVNHISAFPSLASLKWESSTLTFTNFVFQKIASGCPNLEFLFLDKTPTLTDEGVEVLARACTNLRQLALSDCPKIGDAALLSLAKYCPNLQTLVLGNRMITDTGLIALAQKEPFLNTFVLLDAVYSANQLYLHITDASLEALATHCPLLHTLCLLDVVITDQGLAHFRNLVDLNIRGCSRVTAQGVDTLLKNCIKLSTLTIKEDDFSKEKVQNWRNMVRIMA